MPFAPWYFGLDGSGFKMEKRQSKPDGKSAYFLMSNEKSGTNISLFIEPAEKCKSATECSDMVWKLGNPSWENPENIKFSEIGEAGVFEFLVPTFRGLPVRQQNIYAQFVKDGYWIDLHISKALYQPSDRSALVKFVETASFESKSEKPFDDAKAALSSWLSIWDDGKANEAYKQLSGKTRTAIPETTWLTYWTGVRKPLGNVKTRKFGESAYTMSLQGFPDNEGWIFMLETTFESGKTVKETVPLIRDDDGKWRVMNYLN